MKKLFLLPVLSMLASTFLFLASDKNYIPFFTNIQHGDIAACMRLLRARENLLVVPNQSKEWVHIKKVDKASHTIEQLVFQNCALLDHQLAFVLMRVNTAWYKKISEHRQQIVEQFNKEWPHTFFKLPGLQSKIENEQGLINTPVKECMSNNCVDLHKKEEKLLKLHAKDGSSFVYVHPATVQFDASGNLASGYAVDLLDSVYFDEHCNYIDWYSYKGRYLSSVRHIKSDHGENTFQIDYEMHSGTPYRYTFTYPECIIQECIKEVRIENKIPNSGTSNDPRVMYAAATDSQRRVMLFLSALYESDDLEKFLKKESDSYEAYVTVRGWYSVTNCKLSYETGSVCSVLSKPEGAAFCTYTIPFKLFPLYKRENAMEQCTYSCGFRPDGTCCFASSDTHFMEWAKSNLKTWHGSESDIGLLEQRVENARIQSARSNQ